MLERLLLKNFQTHEVLDVRFSPGVTTIQGPTDAGKSAILRALGWVCFNRPSGLNLINWDAEKSTVVLWVDGHVIRRRRSKTLNTYSLDGKPLKAFGVSVPEQITTTIGVTPDNFQWQLDGPFWFSISASQVSKELNAIINLSSMDEALVSIGRDVRQAKVSYEVSKSRLQEAKKGRAKLRFVPKLKQDFDSVVELEQRRDEVNKKLDTLESLIGQAKSLKGDQKTLTSIVRDFEEVENANEAKNQVAGHRRQLTKMLQEAKALRTLATQKPPNLSVVDGLRRKLIKVSRQRGLLQKLIENTNDLDDKKNRLEVRLIDTKRQLKELTKGRCPICNGKYEV